MAEIDIVTTTIAASGTSSPEVDIGNKSIVGLQIPANWTTAAITFQASIDGGASFGNVITIAGSAYTIASITGGTQQYVAIDPNVLKGVNALKIVSGTAQTNAVTLSLVTRMAI